MQNVIYNELSLIEVFEMQKKLDNVIGYHKVDRFEKKVLATIVEISEAANELKSDGFKYWSEKKMDKDKFQEELADVLHFILSIGLEISVDIHHSYDIVKTNYNPINIIFKLIESMLLICKLHRVGVRVHGKYSVLVNDFFVLCHLFGLSPDEMINSYKEKNKVNHERQQNGY